MATDLQGREFHLIVTTTIPETAIEYYIGKHPSELIEGFNEHPRPPGLDWMTDRRCVIKSMFNDNDQLHVELAMS